MDIRGDPRRVSLSTPESRLVRRHHDQLDVSFTSTCQAIRANKEVCPFGCGKLLAPRTIDFHRLNGCRGKQDDAFADLSRKRSFTCGACYEEFVTREAFFVHLASEHAVEATIRSEVFPDFHCFERFRFWLEAQGGAHFRQKSGAKNRPSGKGIFMMCNRSGLVHTTAATGEPDKDKLGSYRMGFTCTAFINGTVYPDGHVSVRYCGDHYGHDARVRMPQSVKNLIMHMQGQGTSNNMIIRYLQERFVPFGHSSIHAQRAAYVDLEELRAITPMFRKLAMIPYEKEEEWEQEFLETAGIARDWGPPYALRPVDWLPIKDFAEKMNWPQPLVFKAKVRNAAGEWLVYDEDRQQYVLESMQRMKADDFLDELDLDYGHQKELREDGEEGEMRDGREEGAEGEVDVEDMSKGGESSHAGTSNSSPVAKKRRMEERRDEGMEGRMEDGMEEEEMGDGEDMVSANGHHHGHDQLQHVQHVQQHDYSGAAGAAAAGSRGCAFLASSIVAELEMMRALVKNEAEFLSEPELSAFLKQTRELRLAFEPRRERRGEDTFTIPQLARPSRVLPSRGRTRAFAHCRTGEMRSLFIGSNAGGWTPLAPEHHHLAAHEQQTVGAHLARAKRGAAGAAFVLVDAADVDAGDEEMMAASGGEKLQYKADLWS